MSETTGKRTEQTSPPKQAKATPTPQAKLKAVPLAYVGPDVASLGLTHGVTYKVLSESVVEAMTADPRLASLFVPLDALLKAKAKLKHQHGALTRNAQYVRNTY